MENRVNRNKTNLLALTNPVPGREEEFDRWYSGQHVSDVLSVDGFVAAQRFRMCEGDGRAAMWSHAAVYEIEGDDPRAAFAALQQKISSGEMHLSDALDMATVSLMILEPITDVVRRSAGGR